MTITTSPPLLATIERCRKRVWALCYRMTGRRADADDLSQEAIARAIEREPELGDRSRLDGWLFRIATTVCLDHLRRERRQLRVTTLVDPLDLADLPAGEPDGATPEAAAILRDDVRFALVVALQRLTPRQRAIVILHDVLDRPLDEIAATVGSNANAVKALLHRGRAALAAARGDAPVDVPVDRGVVEQLAVAISARSLDALTALLAEDVWGVVDGGDVVKVATKPSFGRRAVARRFANVDRRLDIEIRGEVRVLNGEPAVMVVLADGTPFATVHVETHDGRIVSVRVVRDPAKLAGLTAALH